MTPFPMLVQALSAARDLGRLNDIAVVLARHGFGDLVQRSGLGGILTRAGRVVRWDVPPSLTTTATERRVRLAMEQLGPTFVKLGQLLAGRNDLLPPEWIEELSRLHEDVRAVPYEEIAEPLREDLGGEPEDIFASFERTPLAAGSIAQVHAATLQTGESVVLKIRRPGIREKVNADLRLLARLAELVQEELPDLARYRPTLLVRQLARSLHDELDLTVEARNTEAIAANRAEDRYLVIPTIHWRWTSERVCVQTRLDGVSASEWMRTREPQELPTKLLAKRGADAVLDMIFVDGLFHADPHPGNVIFPGGERIGLIDFGMVGRLSEQRRRELIEIASAVVTRDERALVDLLLEWAGDKDPPVELLAQDCRAFIDRHQGRTLAQLDMQRLLHDLTAIVRENDLYLPGDVALLIKVFITLESFGRRLDPDFDMTKHLEPFARRLTRRHLSPLAVARRNLRDVRKLLIDLPRDLGHLATTLRRGRFKLELDLRRLDHFGSQLDRSATRLTIGMITAALIIGTSIAMSSAVGPDVFGVPLLGLFGFVTSCVLGLVIVWTILRTPRA